MGGGDANKVCGVYNPHFNTTLFAISFYFILLYLLYLLEELSLRTSSWKAVYELFRQAQNKFFYSSVAIKEHTVSIETKIVVPTLKYFVQILRCLNFSKP